MENGGQRFWTSSPRRKNQKPGQWGSAILLRVKWIVQLKLGMLRLSSVNYQRTMPVC